MKPSVITSKFARKDLERIRSMHADLVMGIANQQMKVAQVNANKAATLQNENSMRMEMDKAKLTANTATQKNALDFATKQAEIDVKRAALNP